MGGPRELLDACARAAARGERSVLATVVEVAGSAYRRPGARMLLGESGSAVGLISGGCLESDLAERAAAVLAAGRPHTVVYDMRSPDDLVWGLGLGCEGEIRVLLEPIGPGPLPPWLAAIAEASARRASLVLATVYAVERIDGVAVGDRLWLDATGAVGGDLAHAGLRRAAAQAGRRAHETRRSAGLEQREGPGRASLLIEWVPPPVELFVCGAGGDARPLVRLSSELGWRATVIDHREAYADPARFPGASSVRRVDTARLSEAGLALDERTPAVIMTHHFLRDLDLLRFLLAGPAPYVGLIGPRRRGERLLDELRSRGFAPAPAALERLHSPVGLDIGSETPEEIALAVTAEILAVLSGRGGESLRGRAGPLH